MISWPGTLARLLRPLVKLRMMKWAYDPSHCNREPMGVGRPVADLLQQPHGYCHRYLVLLPVDPDRRQRHLPPRRQDQTPPVADAPAIPRWSPLARRHSRRTESCRRRLRPRRLADHASPPIVGDHPNRRRPPCQSLQPGRPAEEAGHRP